MTDKNFFVTLYTDASLDPSTKTAVVAYRGKCSSGTLSGFESIPSHDIHHAEMSAILMGIKAADQLFPGLVGFFVNSDNMGCVKSFWTFGKNKTPGPAVKVKAEIMEIIGDRWIRAKHVKAHTGQSDIRSYMNRAVDRMTR